MPRLSGPEIGSLSDEHGHELMDGHLIIEREEAEQSAAEQAEKMRLAEERRDAVAARFRELFTDPNEKKDETEEIIGDPADIFNAGERVDLSTEHGTASISAEELFITAGTLMEGIGTQEIEMNA